MGWLMNRLNIRRSINLMISQHLEHFQILLHRVRYGYVLPFLNTDSTFEYVGNQNSRRIDSKKTGLREREKER